MFLLQLVSIILLICDKSQALPCLQPENTIEVREQEYHSALQDDPTGRQLGASQAINDVLYIHGGDIRYLDFLGSFHKFNTSNKKWTTLASTVARGYHSSVLLFNDTKFVIYGGALDSSNSRTDVWMYDISSDIWEEVITTNGPVDGLEAHTANSFMDIMFVFGGRKGSTVSYKKNDMWSLGFNLSSSDASEWSMESVSGSVPPKRYFHTTTFYNDTLLVYGGHDGGDGIYEFDLVTNVWTLLDTINSPPSGTGREKHSVALYDHTLYLFGGADGSGYTNQFWKLNLRAETLNWTLLSDLGASVGKRVGTNMHAFGNVLYMFGGYFGTGQYAVNDMYQVSVKFCDLCVDDCAFPHGDCKEINGEHLECVCPDYILPGCVDWECFDVVSTAPADEICNGGGSCESPGYCNCEDDYSLEDCSFWRCCDGGNGMLFNHSDRGLSCLTLHKHDSPTGICRNIFQNTQNISGITSCFDYVCPRFSPTAKPFSVVDQETNEFLTEIFGTTRCQTSVSYPSSPFYLNIIDEYAKNGYHTWIDLNTGAEQNFYNWDVGQPDFSTDLDIFCVEVDQNTGKWKTKSCQYWYHMFLCEYTPLSCFGVFEKNPGVCSDNGECFENDVCVCDESWCGEKCDQVCCFGVFDHSGEVCGTHGNCTSHDNCVCDVGYTGFNCNFSVCFNFSSDEPNAKFEILGDDFETRDTSKWVAAEINDQNVILGDSRCGSDDGNSVAFISAAARQLTTQLVELPDYMYSYRFEVNFWFVAGRVGFPNCEKAVSTDSDVFLYILPQDQTQKLIYRIPFSLNYPRTITTSFWVDRPFQLQWKQSTFSGGGKDVWAIDSVSVNRVGPVCNGGECNSPDVCTCDNVPSHSGEHCEFFSCNEVSRDDLNACSFPNGACVGGDPPKCECFEGFKGSLCETALECDGKFVNDFQCSGRGTCLDIGCECDTPFFGEICESWNCNGISKESEGVCSGFGNCTEPDHCECIPPATYTGDWCQNWYCNDQQNTDENEVCGNHGNCVDFNKCDCDPGFYGYDCENYDCYGSPSCNSNGICRSPDNCECSSSDKYADKECKFTLCSYNPVECQYVPNDVRCEFEVDSNCTDCVKVNEIKACVFSYLFTNPTKRNFSKWYDSKPGTWTFEFYVSFLGIGYSTNIRNVTGVFVSDDGEIIQIAFVASPLDSTPDQDPYPVVFESGNGKFMVNVTQPVVDENTVGFTLQYTYQFRENYESPFVLFRYFVIAGFVIGGVCCFVIFVTVIVVGVVFVVKRASRIKNVIKPSWFEKPKKSELELEEISRKKKAKGNKDRLKKLAKKNVRAWTKDDVICFISLIGLEKYERSFAIYDGESLLFDNLFNDSDISFATLNEIFGKKKRCVEVFLSVLRTMRLYRKLPSILLSQLSMHDFLERSGYKKPEIERYMRIIRAKHVNFAYLLERTDEELTKLFEETNAHFGVLMNKSLEKYTDKIINKKHKEYRRAIHMNVFENRCFKFVLSITDVSNTDEDLPSAPTFYTYDSLFVSPSAPTWNFDQQMTTFAKSMNSKFADIVKIDPNLIKDIRDGEGNVVVLGKGGFGMVTLAYLESFGPVAVKQLEYSNPSAKEEVEKEINVIKNLFHPYVLGIIGYYQPDKKSFRIVTQYLDGGNLFEAWNFGNLTEIEKWNITKMMVMSVEFLHVKKLVHRDIKSMNFLCNKQRTVVKICDFGLSRFKEGEQSKLETKSLAGTLRYMAKECFAGEFTNESDMFALGVTILELVSEKIPYYNVAKEPEVIRKILEEELPPIPSGISQRFREIIVNTVKVDRKSRWSAKRVLEFMNKNE